MTINIFKLKLLFMTGKSVFTTKVECSKIIK